MKPIDVETGELRRAAQQLGMVTEGTDSMLQSFTGELDSHGQPWGDDMLGMAIGTIYQAALNLVLDGMRSNLDTMDGLAERLGVAAEDYDLTDEEAAQRLSAIEEPDVSI